MNTYTIAEFGSCHDNDFDAMLDGIRVAAEAGASVCKFQWTSDPERMAKRRGKAFEDGYADVYRRYLTWPAEWHGLLREACDDAGVDYMCSVFLPEDVAVVAPFVAHFKIASFEAEDAEMWAAHEGKDVGMSPRRVIASMGMGATEKASWGGALTVAPFARRLYCVSAYPAPHDGLCLRAMSGHGYDGLSDHTAPELTWTGALAVAAGAEIVEAHFRLDGTDPANPDYPHAMTPAQLTEYIGNIKFTEECLGTGDTGLQDCERPMLRYKVSGTETRGEPTTVKAT